MFEINFIYKGQEHIIQYDNSTTVKTAFEEFVKKNALKLEDLIFFHNNIKVNLNTNFYKERQFDLEKEIKVGNNDAPIIEILVFNKEHTQKNTIENEEKEYLTEIEQEEGEEEEGEEEIFKKLKNIEINFVYKKTNNIIKCSPKSSLNDICKQFSDNLFLEMNYLMFIYDGTQLVIKNDVSIIRQLKFKPEEAEKYKRIEILVFEEFYQIEFSFSKNNNIPPLNVKETFLVKDIFKKFEELTNLKQEEYNFIYNLKVLNANSQNNSDEICIEDNILDKHIIDIMNKFDKEEKAMTIMVTDNTDSNSEEESHSKDIIKVKFLHKPQDIVIESQKDDKMKDIFQLFLEQAKLPEQDFANIIFFYEGKGNGISIEITEEKTLTKFVSKSDISKKEVIFIPKRKIYKEVTLFDKNSYSNSYNDLNELFLVKMEESNPTNSLFKNFYLINFFIIAIQYFVIISVSAYLFFSKICGNLFTNISVIPFIILFVVFFLSGFFINAIYNCEKGSKSLIFFIILYPALIIFLCLEISSVLEFKYIIIGLSIIFFENLSQGIYVIIFKKNELLFFIISSFVLSSIALIFFSIFWIKGLLQIIYVSIFYLGTIGMNLLLNYISSKYCEYDEYFYSIMIFNYSIFLALANALKMLYFYMKKKYYESEIKKIIKIFFILMIQYSLITISFGIVIFLTRNEYDLAKFHSFFWPSVVAIIIIFIVFMCNIENKNCEGYILCHIFYVPIMFFLYYSFSFVFDGKYILSFICIIFLDLITIIIHFLIFQSEKCIFISCIITDTLIIVPFHFFWLKNDVVLLVISILSICVILYLNIFLCPCEGTLNETLHIAVLTFDYGLFFMVLFIICLPAFLCFYCCCKK